LTLLDMTEPQVKAARIWFAVMLATAALVAFAFKHVDLVVLAKVLPYSHRFEGLGKGLASAVLLAFEALMFLGLAVVRFVRGRLSPFGRATAVACVSSICAYAINANVLKILFGVPAPWQVLYGSPHTAHFLQGTVDSSFPSGHMALAGAFAGALMRHYPKSILPLAGLLAVAGGLLIAGSWHFVSDVLAGTFVGVTAGLLAAEVWIAHERSQAS
jgi:membrane-associated phospholipid phosphatase